MNDNELNDFASRLKLEGLELNFDAPLCFVVDDKYRFTLEYNQNEELVLTLQTELKSYDTETLIKFVKKSSYLEKRRLQFSVGYSRDRLYLMTMLNSNIKGSELVTEVLELLGQYQDIMEG